MRLLTLTIAALLLAVAASPRDAAAAVYGQSFEEFYRIDLADRRAHLIGKSGMVGGQFINRVTGLSYGPDGSIYAVSDSLKALVRIDPASGAAQVVGSLGLSGQGVGQYDALDLGMAADCDGAFWLSSATINALWRVDPSSGAATHVATLAPSITGLAVRDGELLGAAGRGDNRLYRIDTASGATEVIGSFGSQAGWLASVAMSFDDDGRLLAALNYIPPAPGDTQVREWSDLAVLDPDTGVMEVLGEIRGPQSLRGIGIRGLLAGPPLCRAGQPTQSAAAVPASSPWALGLLVLLLLGGALRQQALRARG